MKNKIEEENRMDRVLKELGDLYEFNRKIQEFQFVQKPKVTQNVEEESSAYDQNRKSSEGSE
jgi:hypothetical protein